MKIQEKISEQKIYIEKVRKLNEGKNLKYTVLTMGCQLNENDSEKISGMLEEMGYSKTDKIEDANVVALIHAALEKMQKIDCLEN